MIFIFIKRFPLSLSSRGCHRFQAWFGGEANHIHPGSQFRRVLSLGQPNDPQPQKVRGHCRGGEGGRQGRGGWGGHGRGGPETATHRPPPASAAQSQWPEHHSEAYPANRQERSTHARQVGGQRDGYILDKRNCRRQPDQHDARGALNLVQQPAEELRGYAHNREVPSLPEPLLYPNRKCRTGHPRRLLHAALLPTIRHAHDSEFGGATRGQFTGLHVTVGSLVIRLAGVLQGRDPTSRKGKEQAAPDAARKLAATPHPLRVLQTESGWGQAGELIKRYMYLLP